MPFLKAVGETQMLMPHSAGQIAKHPTVLRHNVTTSWRALVKLSVLLPLRTLDGYGMTHIFPLYLN